MDFGGRHWMNFLGILSARVRDFRPASTRWAVNLGVTSHIARSVTEKHTGRVTGYVDPWFYFFGISQVEGSLLRVTLSRSLTCRICGFDTKH
jgi:hypothetical protein